MDELTTILCEKPSQALAISQMFGLTAADKQSTHYYNKNKKLCVLNARGHLFELAPPEYYEPDLKKGWRISKLPVFPPTYSDFILCLKPEFKKVFDDMKKRLGQTTMLLIATDPDDEGELIAKDIIQFANYKGEAKRIICSSTYQKELKAAFNKPIPCEKTAPLAFQADLRRKVDWLIGMNGTMAATAQLTRSNLLSKKKVFNVGRVISALSLIVFDREQSIKNFKPTIFYKIKANFKNGDNVFSAYLDLPEQLLNDDGYLIDEKIAYRLKEGLPKSFIVKEFATKKKSNSAPLTYCLSDMQVEAGKYGITPDHCLQVIQNLYDSPNSVLTYPRTNCRYLPTAVLEQVTKIISHLNKSIPVFSDIDIDLNKCPRCFNDEKVTAHHAIIPTTKSINFDRLTDNEKAIYLLVAKRFLQQFMADFTYNETKLVIGDDKFSFGCKGKQIISLGWKELASGSNNENLLPKLDIGQVINVTDFVLEKGVTKAPKRLGLSELVSVMENPARFVRDDQYKQLVSESSGIGTSATQSDVIKRATANGLISVDKGGKFVRPGDLVLRFASYLSQFSVENSVLLQGKINEISSKKNISNEDYELFLKIVKSQVSKWKKI